MQRRDFLRLTTIAALSGASATACVSVAPRRMRQRVIIVGGGFAGATCARYLGLVAADVDIVLIDPDDQYISCPMSNSVIAGLRDLASITIPRRHLDRAGVHRVRATVTAIDADRQQVHLHDGVILDYDRLVLAAGIRFRWDALEGYDEAASLYMPHAWKAGAQTELLRARLHAMDDGGVVAISVPSAPFRCPPGPYERASLIAHFLQRHKPRSKLLIFDANNRFSKQGLFTEAWAARYPHLIEWIPVTEGGALTRVDPTRNILHGANGTQRVALANIIPPQAAPALAVASGLASDHGWCPVHPSTFESTLVGKVHVIGDACIADPMPKSASSANSQAKHCALAIAALLEHREPPAMSLHNTCYSLIAPDYGISISAIYRVVDEQIHQVEGSGGTSIEQAPGELRECEAAYAEGWYRNIVADSFGV
jgi:NADPH-dependent 2,4-dienoyl-CoA reductase/sulfur reductase-like enzyme